MSFTENEIKKYTEELESYIEKIRPKPEIRNEIDIEYKINSQSIEIIENRKINSSMIESPIAKATYIKSTEEWKIYWKKSDMKWHLYEPKKVRIRTLEDAIRIIEKDEYGCFWG